MSGKILRGIFGLSLCCASGVAQADPASVQKNLLAALLKQAANLTASMANVAENLHRVDGSVAILSGGKSTDMIGIINDIARQHPTGPVSQVSSISYSSDLSSNVLDTLKPTIIDSGLIATTSIGSLQSGALIGSTGTTGTIDTSGLVLRVTLVTSTAANHTTAVVESFGSIANTTALQNVASNLGDVDSSIQVRIEDTLARFNMLSTTAIGAMESGMLTASLTGNINVATDRLTSLTAALIGP